MQVKDLAKGALHSTQEILTMYLSDLSDADLFVRPVPKANDIAWQLSHLMHAEVQMGAMFPGAAYPELPAAIVKLAEEKGTPAKPPAGKLTKAEYLDWFNKVRSATIAAVDKMTEADFDKPTSGEMQKYAPTLGALALLHGNHTLMHAGQFTVVRRALGKPVLF